MTSLVSIKIAKSLSGTSSLIGILTSVSSLYKILLCTSVYILWSSIYVRGILGSGKLAPLFSGTLFLVARRPAPFVAIISILSFFLSLPVTGPTSSAFNYSNESIATTEIFESVKLFIYVSSRDGIVNLTSKFLLVDFQSLVHVIFLLDLTRKILLDCFTVDYSRTFY